MEFVMSNQGLDKAGKEGWRRLLVRWDPTMNAFFAVILRRRLDVETIGLAVAVLIDTVHGLDDLRELIARLAPVDEDSLRQLETTCDGIPFPSPFYLMLH